MQQKDKEKLFVSIMPALLWSVLTGCLGEVGTNTKSSSKQPVFHDSVSTEVNSQIIPNDEIIVNADEIAPQKTKINTDMINKALADIPSDAEKTLSPFFFVVSDNSETDSLPLKSTNANIRIAGVIADVSLTQVYKNDGNNPLEALYLFPTSVRAAVYAMKMTVGNRIIEAKIRKKEDAKKEYEQALNEGKTASILEQQRPNVFQMSVGNILPGDVIKVVISYTELLIPTDRIYEFVLPSTVGPRYSNSPASDGNAKDHWVANPYLHAGLAPTYTFGVDLAITGGMPIKQLSCPSHKVEATFDGPFSARVKLADGPFGNKDFTIKYSLSGDQIQNGVLLYPGKDESFFLAMIQPPDAVSAEQVLRREYIFLIDVSGSMHGFPISVTKTLMKGLFNNFKEGDFFNVVLFANGSAVLSNKSLPATPNNIKNAMSLIDSQYGSGGTELLSGLKTALSLPQTAGISRTVVIITDGYVDVEKEAFETVSKNMNKANFFAFGIGNAVNRYLIEGIARAGRGEPFIAETEEIAISQAAKFNKYIQSPVLTDINVSFEGFNTYDVEPLSLPDLFAERPTIIFGKYQGEAAGTIRIKGKHPHGDLEKTLSVAGYDSKNSTTALGSNQNTSNNAALRYLWARERIAKLGDFNRLAENDNSVKEITALGLKYNLMTDYTSFVAVDTEIRADGKKVKTIRQPLPLPQGVSDSAVGNLSALNMIGHCGGGGRGGGGTGEGSIGLMGKRDSKISTVRSGTAMVKGSVSKEVIRRIVYRHINEVKFCYERELSKQPNLSGHIVIKFTILPNGSVQTAAIENSTIGSGPVETCIVKAVQRWIFPAPSDGATVTVIYPFEISTVP